MPRTREQLQQAAEDAERWLEQLDPAALDDPASNAAALRRVAAAVQATAASQAELAEAVRAAREHGHTWTQIATMLGTTRQAAQERYGQPATAETVGSGGDTHRGGRHEGDRDHGRQSMAKGDIHTSKQGDRWVNKAEGNERASNSAPTKAEAQALGRQMAIDRGVEHVIHNQDGTIGERNTYPRSRDPKQSKG